MAGNVKEWCANEVDRPARCATSSGAGGTNRAIASPSRTRRIRGRRTNTFGVRLVKNLGPGRGGRRRRSSTSTRDPSHRRPGVRRAVRGATSASTTTTSTPLDARVESVDDDSPYWRKETVSFAAAYGNERDSGLPVRAEEREAAVPDDRAASRRAYARRGAVERQRSTSPCSSSSSAAGARCCIRCIRARSSGWPARRPGRSGARDMQVQWVKDFRRSVDYLETRPELDTEQLGYYGLSMGAFFAPDTRMALEPRIKAAVVRCPEVCATPRHPEMHPANFCPRGEDSGAAREREGRLHRVGRGAASVPRDSRYDPRRSRSWSCSRAVTCRRTRGANSAKCSTGTTRTSDR